MKGLGRAAMPPPTITHGKKMVRQDEIDDDEMETDDNDEMRINRAERH